VTEMDKVGGQGLYIGCGSISGQVVVLDILQCRLESSVFLVITTIVLEHITRRTDFL
jgi:hypothetical protein